MASTNSRENLYENSHILQPSTVAERNAHYNNAFVISSDYLNVQPPTSRVNVEHLRFYDSHPKQLHGVEKQYRPNSQFVSLREEKVSEHKMTDAPVFRSEIQVNPRNEKQTQMLRNEDEYRNWLTKKYRYRFEQYSTIGGMPNQIFLETFAKEDLIRNKKLHNFIGNIDVNQDRKVSWQEFFNYMTYTKKSEVPTRRKFLNALVKSAAPAAKKAEKQNRRSAELDGEPVPRDAYLEFYDCKPPPIFVPLLLITIWIFFIIYAVELNAGPEWNRVTWTGGVPYYSPLAFCPARRQEVWRFISYQLLHVGYHHIFFNTALTIILGIPLELVHKAWRVGPVWMAGVIAGAGLSSVIEPAITLVGASGGVYALIGAHFGLVIMNWEELQKGWLDCKRSPLAFFSSGIFRLCVLLLLVCLDFGIALYKRYALSIQDASSLTAHLGGLIFGILIGIPVLKNIDEKPWERFVFIIAIVAASIFLVFVIFWNIFYTGYPTAIPCNGT